MWPHAPLVEKGDCLRDALAQADLAQDVDEVPLVLSINMLQRDCRDRNLLQGPSTERIRGSVAQSVQERTVVILHHRRKLEEVADTVLHGSGSRAHWPLP